MTKIKILSSEGVTYIDPDFIHCITRIQQESFYIRSLDEFMYTGCYYFYIDGERFTFNSFKEAHQMWCMVEEVLDDRVDTAVG